MNQIKRLSTKVPANVMFVVATLLMTFVITAPAAEVIKPQIGEPPRDPSICVGPDKTYYLTGTTAIEGKDGKPDFNNCRGMKVWSSKDLKAWKDLGFIWDCWDPKQNYTTAGSPNLFRGWRAYQGDLLPLPGLTPGERACGMTAPRLVFNDGRFWVGYSVCGFAAGAMSTPAADIKGPWDDHRLLAEAHGAETDRSDAQVFVDKDGTRYLLWGGGCLAKLRPREDLLAMNKSNQGYPQVGHEDDVHYLPAAIDGYPGDDGLPEHGAPYGVFLFHDGSQYVFLFTATTYRDGDIHEDAYACMSSQLHGPYSKPRPFLLDGGRCMVFKDTNNNLRTLHSSADGQPVIEPYSPTPVKTANQKPEKARRGEIVTKVPLLPPSDKPEDVEQDVEMIEPLFDHPLRDAAICKGGDDNWYMVGTEASRAADGKLDWSNNNGIRLWQSADRKDWKDLGYVWDCDKDGGEWNQRLHLDRTIGARPRLGRAVTAPEIHYLKNNYWIVYSMNGQGIGILKSKTGKPKSPYANHGRLTRQGRDPSLFEDDGQVYLVWGQGFYAKLNDDLSAIDGPVKTLFTNVKWYSRYLRRINIMGQWGSHLVKAGKWYIWTFTTRTGRAGVNSIDTLASWSESLDGPWCEPCVMLVNGGQSTLTPDGTGRFFATVSGEDEYAQCPYVPAITEVRNDNGQHMGRSKQPLNTLPNYGPNSFIAYHFAVNSVKATEIDFWIGNPKFIDCGIRDVWCGQLDDSGYYYLSGSFWGQKRWKNQVAFYRSKDLIHWEPKPGAIMTLEEMKKHPDFMWDTYKRAIETEKKKAERWGRKFEDMWPVQMAEPKALRTRDGTIYVIISAFNAGSFVLKSKSKTMDGPFEIVRGKVPFGTIEEADDGGLLINLPSGIGKAPAGETIETVTFSIKKHHFHHYRNLCMEEDCEVGVFQIDGKWVTWSADWNGNYDMLYRVADSLEGPWRNLRVGATHGGNGDIFQREDGSWWYAGFYNCNDYATRVGDPSVFTRLYIMPLHVGWHEDELIIEPKAVRRNRARLEKLGALWQSPRKR